VHAFEETSKLFLSVEQGKSQTDSFDPPFRYAPAYFPPELRPLSANLRFKDLSSKAGLFFFS